MLFPDFLCIGAQKAGTSWLYYNLKKHPDIYLPPIKELHYFDEKEINPGLSLMKRLFSSSDWRYARWRQLVVEKIILRISRRNYENIGWYFKYLFLCRNDRSYGNLFKTDRKISGEITPAYSILETKSIRKVYKINSSCKIIFITRNPVERAWSHALMDLVRIKKRDFLDVKDSEFIAHFNSEGSLQRGDYSSILQNWNSFFPLEQILVCRFEKIKNNPKKLLGDIFSFLDITQNVDYNNFPYLSKINKSTKVPIPHEYRKILEELYKHA